MKNYPNTMGMVAAKKRINLKNPLHLLATGFGSGMCPWIPGTTGSLISLPIVFLMMHLSWPFYFLVVILSICLGVFLCDQTSKDIGAHDHSCIVWDELVGISITMITIPINNWYLIWSGFLLFRLIDLWKPYPIDLLDIKIHGGIGIMIDDIAAGMISTSILYLYTYIYK